MTDLEKYIRSALDNGATSEGVAKELSSVLNTIEKEKKEEAERQKKAAETKKKDEEKRARDELYDELVDEFDAHWEDGREMSAWDAAIVALMVAMGKPANNVWTKDDVEQFMKDMTETIEMGLKLHEGHSTPEDQLDKALKMASDKFGKAMEEVNKTFGYSMGDWSNRASKSIEKCFDKIAEEARVGTMTLEDWIKRQSW